MSGELVLPGIRRVGGARVFPRSTRKAYVYDDRKSPYNEDRINKPKVERLCLRCDKPFKTDDPKNQHLCYSCNIHNQEWFSGLTEEWNI